MEHALLEELDLGPCGPLATQQRAPVLDILYGTQQIWGKQNRPAASTRETIKNHEGKLTVIYARLEVRFVDKKACNIFKIINPHEIRGLSKRRYE